MDPFVWLLIMLIPLGTPDLYISESLKAFDTKRECVVKMNEQRAQDDQYKYVCVKVPL